MPHNENICPHGAICEPSTTWADNCGKCYLAGRPARDATKAAVAKERETLRNLFMAAAITGLSSLAPPLSGKAIAREALETAEASIALLESLS